MPSSGMTLTISNCNDNSLLNYHLRVQPITVYSESGYTDAGSYSKEFSPNCPDDDEIAIMVDGYVNDAAGNRWSSSSYTTGICCNENQEWSLGDSKCCWKTTGAETDCSDDSDCCESNICSNNHCCPSGEVWNGNDCAAPGADDAQTACENAGYNWLGYITNIEERWRSGTPFCEGNQQEYHISEVKGSSLDFKEV